MDILGGIAAATEGLKLVNELRKIDKEVDKAELKLRLVDLADKLLDAKQALQEAHENQNSLKTEIARLEAVLKLRANLEDENGLLYELNDAKERIGAPFCNLCFVREDKQFRMRHSPAKAGVFEHYRCDNCKTTVVVGPSLPREPSRMNSGRNSWMK